MKYFFLLIFLSCSLSAAEYRYQLSICAIFQNEAPYLKEWLEYHRLLGVEHFFLINHLSQDHFQEVLEPYIQEGIVELKNEKRKADTIQTFNPLQCNHYTECIKNARGISKWVAFIDIDEFILPMEKKPLLDILAPFEKFGAVGVNWLMFGTSNVKKIPEDRLLIEMLTSCTETGYANNRYVKSIIRPEFASHFENPHQPVFLDDYFAVNTNKLPFDGDMSDYVLSNKLRINHYWTKDEDFFYKRKIDRQKHWGGKPNPESIFKKMNVKQDETILRYVPELRKRVFSEEPDKALPPTSEAPQ